MDHHRLAELLDGFVGKRVLVVGDCMLDEYIRGQISRVSPEAPVMVVEHRETDYAAGGASNAAVNIAEMGGAASIVAVAGDDPDGHRLRDELARRGVGHEGLVLHPQRPTTRKTRIIARDRQVMRLD